MEPNRRYAESAMANIRWAVSLQRGNGWFDRCCLTDPSQALTHTIGYALRGVLEAHRFTGDASLLAAARRTADGALTALRGDGFLAGRLDAEWRGTVGFACLTGSVQIAHCWLMLYQQTGDPRYLEAARTANAYVRRTVRLEGDQNTRGGVKGSFPVSGEYGRYEYLNWAGKFFIDANLLEQDVASDVAAELDR